MKALNLYKRNPGQAAGSGATKPGKTASHMTREKEGGSWTWFLMKFVLFGLALTGGYVGYTIYRTRQRDRF